MKVAAEMDGNPEKVLFIRRDNIGDLLCTTPAIRAFKERYPQARVGVLVNSYNADVIRGNPDVDCLYVYEKEKHVTDRGRLSVWLSNLRLMRRIRAEGFDVAIGCGSYSPSLARYTFFTGAGRRIGYVRGETRCLFYNMAVPEPMEEVHEVIKTFRLLEPLGIEGEPGVMRLLPDPQELERFEEFRGKADSGRPLVAVAISARIRKNRWPLEKFTSLIERLIFDGRCGVLLLWAPGDESNPLFPGDEEWARLIRGRFGERITAYPTPALGSLVAAIASSQAVVSLDTGSLHISAALEKPTVALMTRDKARCWYPWKTESIVIRADGAVEEIGVEEVFDAVRSLVKDCGKAGA